MSAVSHSAIAKQLMGEATESAKNIARDLFGDVPAGMQKLPRDEFFDFIRRNWEFGEPGLAFRQGLLNRFGQQRFLEMAEAAGVIGDWKETLVTVPQDNTNG